VPRSHRARIGGEKKGDMGYAPWRSTKAMSSSHSFVNSRVSRTWSCCACERSDSRLHKRAGGWAGGCVRKSLGQGASVSRLGGGGGKKACARCMRTQYGGYVEEGADESESEEGRARDERSSGEAAEREMEREGW
jgi:hypothetical protein